MSSILKALKKAENRPPSKIEHKFWQYSWNTPKPPDKPSRNPNIILWIICLLLGVNILVVSGRYLWPNKAMTPEASIETAAPRPQSSSESNTFSSPAKSREEGQNIPSQTPETGTAAGNPEKTGPIQNRSTSKGPDLSGYRLEGLVYTESARERFAVINGEIVRKGESVGEILVTGIHETYVEVRLKKGSHISRLNLY